MDEQEKKTKLVDQVKRKCHVSWDDDITNQRLEDDIIPTAKAYMTERLALPEGYDFLTPGTVNILFLAYCFYLFNDAEDEFELNYASTMRAARRTWEVNEYVEETESPSELP